MISISLQCTIGGMLLVVLRGMLNTTFDTKAGIVCMVPWIVHGSR
jgi:hypothetical protein